MTLRELLHRQIDQLDHQQLSVLESMVGQLVPRRAQTSGGHGAAPYKEARRILAGQSGPAQSIIERRRDRV